MSGSVENCTVEILRKLCEQRWPEQYHIKGNEALSKGVVFTKLGEHPFECAHFDKNNDAYLKLIDPKWQPDMPAMPKGFFEFNKPPVDNTAAQRLFYEKLICDIHSLDERLKLINVDLQQSPQWLIDTLSRRIQKIRLHLKTQDM
jgi:hypothetical protein